MELIDFLLSALSVENGIFAFGWAIAVFFIYKTVAGREEQNRVVTQARDDYEQRMNDSRTEFEKRLNDSRAEYDRRLEEIHEAYSTDLKDMYDRMQELNRHHSVIMSDLSDKRVEDLKSLTEDYNVMAESVLQAMDKLSQSISRKKS